MPEFEPDPRAEKLREDHGFDIISREALSLLIDCAVAAAPERILEIGTSVGYSALCLAAATGACVDTIERDADKLAKARELWRECGEDDKITGFCGDALELVPQLVRAHRYDFVFLDAAKSKYGVLVDEIYDFIDTGTKIFADDVNYFGLVKGNALPPHKHRTIVVNMRKFLAKATDPKLFDTQLFDMANGVAICTKI